MTKPLEGVRIIDMSHVIAGPMASLYLSQLGAEVIKIEPPKGEVMRASRHGRDVGEVPAGFAALNAGKRSLALDAKQAEHAQLILRLAQTADVFIENFRPGVVARLGLDEDAVRQAKPNIIYCSISGYGQQGEWAQRGAYDHVIQALTGMMMMSGDDESAPPVKVGFPVIDVAVGILAALAIVAAVHQRSGDGLGQRIDASMLQAATMLMYPHASSYLTHGISPVRVGNKGYTGSPGADTFRCSDGWLAVAANTPVQFRVLADTLGVPTLCGDAQALDLQAFNAPNAGFVVAVDAQRVRDVMSRAFASQSARYLETCLNNAGVPAARVRRLDEFLEEAQDAGMASRPYQQRDGTIVRTPGLGFAFEPPHPPSVGAPALGADTLTLLAELGVDAENIDLWRHQGFVTASNLT